MKIFLTSTVCQSLQSAACTEEENTERKENTTSSSQEVRRGATIRGWYWQKWWSSACVSLPDAKGTELAHLDETRGGRQYLRNWWFKKKKKPNRLRAMIWNDHNRAGREKRWNKKINRWDGVLGEQAIKERKEWWRAGAAELTIELIQVAWKRWKMLQIEDELVWARVHWVYLLSKNEW